MDHSLQIFNIHHNLWREIARFATPVNIKIIIKKTVGDPTLKFSPVVQNNQIFVWKKVDKILFGQNDPGQGDQVTVGQIFWLLKITISRRFAWIELSNSFNLVFYFYFQVQQELRYSSSTLDGRHESDHFGRGSMTHNSDTG